MSAYTLHFLYKNKTISKPTTYMIDFPAFLLEEKEKKLFCFERFRPIFSVLCGGLTFHDVQQAYQEKCEHPLQDAPSPGPPSRRRDEREGERSAPTALFLAFWFWHVHVFGFCQKAGQAEYTSCVLTKGRAI